MSTKANDLAAKHGGNLAGIVGLGRSSAPPPPSTPAAPDKFGGAIRSRMFAELPIDQVDRDPTQPREEFDQVELQSLADSIAGPKGQLTPIRVRPGIEPGRWVVLAGERRYRACKLAGKTTIRVEFVDRVLTDADILEEQILENVARADFKPYEEGKGYRRLMNLRNWSTKELAAGLNVDPTRVHRALGMTRLPEDVGALVDAQQIKPTAAYEISKLADPDEQRAVAQAVVEHDLDHKAVVAAVSRRRARAEAGEPKLKAEAKGRAPAKPQRPTFEVFRAGGAKITVEFRRAVTPRAVLEALEDAVISQRGRVEAIEGGDQVEA